MTHQNLRVYYSLQPVAIHVFMFMSKKSELAFFCQTFFTEYKLVSDLFFCFSSDNEVLFDFSDVTNDDTSPLVSSVLSIPKSLSVIVFPVSEANNSSFIVGVCDEGKELHVDLKCNVNASSLFKQGTFSSFLSSFKVSFESMFWKRSFFCGNASPAKTAFCRTSKHEILNLRKLNHVII